MNEKIVGLFKCRNCGSIFDGKVEVTQSVSWAIKDMSKEVEYTTTAAFHGTSLPGRFIVHRCKKGWFCICDLVGWKIGEEAHDCGEFGWNIGEEAQDGGE